MELYAPQEALAPVEAALASSTGPARLGHLVALAWHLRQRDTPRAESLAAQALALLDGGTPADGGLRGRLALARAECALLLARYADAEANVARAREGFGERSDSAGLGDCSWLEARIADFEREIERVKAELEAKRKHEQAASALFKK